MRLINLLNVAVVLVNILETDGSTRLENALVALSKGLRYMKDHVYNINLDGVILSRFVEEQLKAYLQFEPEILERIRSDVEELQNIATFVSDEGIKQVKENDQVYYRAIGGTMDRSLRLLWYPSRTTNPHYAISPVPYFQSFINITLSDSCLRHATGSWDNSIKICTITDDCVKWTTTPKQRDYVLTHQMLYWQFLEMRDCATISPPALQEYFCSNVMRDAIMIANANFPIDYQDLFMEQIGLCGMWGFADFYKPEWLDKILEWQLSSGCYTYLNKFYNSDNLASDAKIRVKRHEKLMTGQCLSHKTGVALIAITVSIRFEAERLYNDIIAT